MAPQQQVSTTAETPQSIETLHRVFYAILEAQSGSESSVEVFSRTMDIDDDQPGASKPVDRSIRGFVANLLQEAPRVFQDCPHGPGLVLECAYRTDSVASITKLRCQALKDSLLNATDYSPRSYGEEGGAPFVRTLWSSELARAIVRDMQEMERNKKEDQSFEEASISRDATAFSEQVRAFLRQAESRDSGEFGLSPEDSVSLATDLRRLADVIAPCDPVLLPHTMTAQQLVKKLEEDCGMSRKGIGRAVGVQTAHISRIATGDVSQPREGLWNSLRTLLEKELEKKRGMEPT